MSEAVAEPEVGEAPVAEVVAETATPESSPAPVEAKTEDLSFTDTFVSKIENEELKSSKMWDRLKGKSADEVAQYMTEMNAWNGKKGDIPSAEASPEEWAQFHAKMGKPENIDGYDFSIGQEFNELVGEANVPYYQQKVDAFKAMALENNLSADVAGNMLEWYFNEAAGDVTGVSELAQKSKAENQAIIDKEWGDGKASIEGAIHAMLTKAGADMDGLKASGILSDPQFAIPLGQIAKDLADDPEIGHHMTRSLTGMHDQLGEVNSEILNLMSQGKVVPKHLKSKLYALREKLGDDI